MKKKVWAFALVLTVLMLAAWAPVRGQISSFTPAQAASEKRTEYYGNGDQYSGEFANGMYNGKGKYVWANGDRYEGEFKDGQIHGVGRLTYASGEYWEGIFNFGVIDSGYGTFAWGSSGETVKGSWLNGMPEGLCTLRHANGSTEQVSYTGGIIQRTGSYSGGDQSQWGNQGSQTTYSPFKNLQPGVTLAFGNYEQDNNYYNGKEPITWTVLAVQNGRALLLSQKLLEALPYNYAQASVTWEGSTIRSWLNSTFYNDAFSAQEKPLISQNWITNPANPVYGTYGGNNTFDNVFLLSMDEVSFYFPYEAYRKASPTAVARAHGAYGTADRNCAWWWLRSPGQGTSSATSINSIGVLLNTGPLVSDTTGGIRPAIWVML